MRLELRKGQGVQPWRLYLLSANNKILSVSEGYFSKWNAKRAAKRNFPGIPFKDTT